MLNHSISASIILRHIDWNILNCDLAGIRLSPLCLLYAYDLIKELQVCTQSYAIYQYYCPDYLKLGIQPGSGIFLENSSEELYFGSMVKLLPTQLKKGISVMDIED